MQKIKYGVLDKLLRADLSRAEMDFILHISHYQDDTGCVSGIYYRDICEALQISYQTFYDVLRSLQAKEIIKVDKAFYGDWDVTILDNSFQNGITGYVSTGDDLFLDPEFQKCGPQEKLLALEFLKIAKNPSNGGKYRIGKEKLLEKYGKLFSVTKRIILRYLHRLKRFFVMSITEGIYYIRPNAHFAEKNSGKTDSELLREHVNRFVLRRNRATYTEKEGKEASKLLTQYAGQVPDNRTLIRLFSEAVLESIRIRNAGIRNRYKWNRRLNPKFVHRLLQEKILNQPQMAK